MTELALPAGSLQAAMHAFAAGADAVYFGMQQFSARKAARNFSFEDLLRVKQLAVAQGKRIYVAVNTLACDNELDDVVRLLKHVALAKPDGVIVQDLGIAHMIHSLFGSLLPLHASTQLAVHTADGVRILQELGFSRVVLARELTLGEIKRIRESCRDIELKVFIHGALCYGFSGLCMASHTLTGRSANRGECAQICRSWFSIQNGNQDKETNDGYWFSMTDMESSAHTIQALKAMGIDSLKVEGRMKSPGYAAATAHWYRLLLDGETDPAILSAAMDHARTEFSRLSSSGWLGGYGREEARQDRQGQHLATSDWPGHRGIMAGTVASIGSTRNTAHAVRVQLTCDLAVRDGLLAMGNFPILGDPLRFSLAKMWDVAGKAIMHASKGDTVAIAIPNGTQVAVGDTLHKISAHDANTATINEQAIPRYRHPIDMRITILQDEVVLEADLGITCTPWPVRLGYPLAVQQSNTPRDVLADLQSKLAESGDSLVTSGTIAINNTTNLSSDRLFFPLSQLKQMRRQWYALLDKNLGILLEAPASRITAQTSVRTCKPLPERSVLQQTTPRGLPWIDVQAALLRIQSGEPVESVVPVVAGDAYIPLSPVTFDEDGDRVALQHLVRLISTTNRKLGIRIGLNNPAHLAWARSCPEATCFADVYLYIANHLAAETVLDHADQLNGMYQWIESSTEKSNELEYANWLCKASPVGTGFLLPIFVSRSCFRHDSLGLSCTGCPRNGRWEVSQQEHRYEVVVHNCITVVTKLT